jgi:LmbE family N-acetylglucosaminyl deacetylase
MASSRQTASPAASSATLINRRRPQLAAKRAAAKKKTAAKKAKARNVSVTRRAPATRTTRKLTVVTEVPDRAMVIFAHPDDAEIGSGGVVARWAAAGCEVTYVLCTNGSAGTADRSLTPEELVDRRAAEQRAAADFMGVKNLVMLPHPDGGLEDTREFRGDIVRAIRTYRPHTVFAHDPYRFRGFQHRDHRAVGIVTTDAVYPFARDHLHFPEHIVREGLEPHKVRELWYWGADEPDVIVDVSTSIDKQIAALVRHESQMPGFNVGQGETIGERVKKGATERARGYGFKHAAAFRRLIARS